MGLHVDLPAVRRVGKMAGRGSNSGQGLPTSSGRIGPWRVASQATMTWASGLMAFNGSSGDAEDVGGAAVPVVGTEQPG